MDNGAAKTATGKANNCRGQSARGPEAQCRADQVKGKVQNARRRHQRQDARTQASTTCSRNALIGVPR